MQNEDVGAILERQDSQKSEEYEAAGINVRSASRQSIYRPLTMSNWMFEAIHSITRLNARRPCQPFHPCRVVHRFGRL